MGSFNKIFVCAAILSLNSQFVFGENDCIEDRNMLLKARSLFINGDVTEANDELQQFLLKNPESTDGRNFERILLESIDKTNQEARISTRGKLLSNVNNSWEINEHIGHNVNSVYEYDSCILQDKITKIIIPHVYFSNAPLSRVIDTLSELSLEYDNTTNDEMQRGINIVLFNGKSNSDPLVNLNLRNLSVDRILRFISQSIGFKYDIDDDVVVISPADCVLDNLETKFFPISRATIVRLLGSHGGNSKKPMTENDEEAAIQKFFQRAGIDFIKTSGSNLAFDGSQLIVTHTSRNLNLMGAILRKYSKMKQVEIETKFLEVQQGALDELAFRWGFNTGSGKIKLNTGKDSVDNLRTLSGTFGNTSSSGGEGKIVMDGQDVLTISNPPPANTGNINLGLNSVPFADMFGIFHGNTVSLMIRALEQQTGSDLMSAPKVTVLSGKTAEIVVAQEMRYPESYGETHSEVGSGSSLNSSTSAGVTITAGTPRDFVTRNVGVEMKVTPTVEEDGCISLQLEPKVTEFEGFVEYGGMSVAVSAGATVTVPSGFYQPVFSTREIRTEVTVRDGATVVMGGLTREEVKEVKDKVPLLGDIPLLGKLFRSKGKTSQKKNLMIFVTAKTLSPNDHTKPKQKSFDSLLAK